MSNLLRKIPPVSGVLEKCLAESWSREYTRNELLQAIREELSEIRSNLQEKPAMFDEEMLMERIRLNVKRASGYSLKRVINASGVIVHTNLGRAPLSKEALEHVKDLAEGYSNLELELETGQRGSRDQHLEELFRELLSTEASLIVNNNAAALLLILNSLAESKEVLVSRGELIEIGGSFRLPEIMKRSGAILKEVGTTNKTRTNDYRKALNENTAMILVVHPSNYQIIGFTERPQLEDLIELGNEHGVPVVEDQGSGTFVDLQPFGIPDEPTVRERFAKGLDLICFSGDKILGGPQSGIVCGKKIWIQKLRNNPLFRALRVDKIIYGALEATLHLYRKGRFDQVPVIAAVSQATDALKQRAQEWLSELQDRIPHQNWSLEATTNYIGGGVAPMKGLPSFAVALSSLSLSPQEIAHQLREQNPPVLARIEADSVLFELRTITPEEQKMITSSLQQIFSQDSKSPLRSE